MARGAREGHNARMLQTQCKTSINKSHNIWHFSRNCIHPSRCLLSPLLLLCFSGLCYMRRTWYCTEAVVRPRIEENWTEYCLWVHENWKVKNMDIAVLGQEQQQKCQTAAYRMSIVEKKECVTSWIAPIVQFLWPFHISLWKTNISHACSDFESLFACDFFLSPYQQSASFPPLVLCWLLIVVTLWKVHNKNVIFLQSLGNLE